MAIVTIAQGGYFLVTGVWPLVSMRSFELITGLKVDKWLVKTIGALIAVVGASLLVAGARRRIAPELALLGIGSAASLAAADTVYALRRRISRVYLLDAGLELGLIGGWIAACTSVQSD